MVEASEIQQNRTSAEGELPKKKTKLIFQEFFRG